MVDKATARVLVYSTIGVLAVLLLVAVFALSSKSKLQTDLEKQIKVLEERKKELKREQDKQRDVQRERADKEERFKREAAARARKEVEKAKALQDKDEMEYAREQERREAKALKKRHRRLTEKEKRHRRREDQEEEEGKSEAKRAEEKDYQEYLSTLSDEDLKKEMDDRAKEFAKYRETLVSENVDEEDRGDLRNETEKSDLFLKQYQAVKESGHSPESLERLEELGEQNEVFLEDLDRDAKRNKGGKWKEKSNPRRMEKVARQIDQEAEALRSRAQQRKLEKAAEGLQKVQDAAHATGDKKFERKVSGWTAGVESQVDREKRELGEGEEQVALKQALALEEYAQHIQQQVGELERITNNTELSQAEKEEHDKVLKLLEAELGKIEAQAIEIEQGLQRRALRQDTMEMSKDANAISGLEPAGKLRDSGRVVSDVEKILKIESELINAMKNGQKDSKAKDQLSEKLQEKNEELEQDAQLLYGEAKAENFKQLDDKLDAQRLAKGLRKTADSMDRSAIGVEHSDARRELRRGAAQLHAKALDLNAKPEMKNLKKQEEVVQKAETAVNDDARQLDNAVAEENWETEEQISDKTLADIAHLEQGASDLEKELKEYWDQMGEDDRKQYRHSIDEMRGQANSLKRMVEEVQQDVKHKAGQEVQKLRFKADQLKPLLKLKKFEPAPKPQPQH